MKYIILLSVILIFSSCVTKKKCLEKFPPVSLNEVEINTTYRDHVITLRMQSEQVQNQNDIIIISDSVINVEPSYIETSHAYSRAYIENNKLFHTLFQREIISDTIIQIKEVEKLITEKQVTEVPVNPWYVKYIVSLLVISIIAIFVIGYKKS